MASVEFEQLKLLHDYTKFHIALYTTLIAALLSLMGLGQDAIPAELVWPLQFAVISFVCAGACGGIVASSSVKFQSISTFRETRIGPLGIPMLPGKEWATLEHFCFWVGIIYAVFSVVTHDYSSAISTTSW